MINVFYLLVNLLLIHSCLEHCSKNDSEAALDFSREEYCDGLVLPAVGAKCENYGVCQVFAICSLNQLSYFTDDKTEAL